jgi:hypothetical protein
MTEEISYGCCMLITSRISDTKHEFHCRFLAYRSGDGNTVKPIDRGRYQDSAKPAEHSFIGDIDLSECIQRSSNRDHGAF